ncbi:hypothetical protein D7T48_20785 [Stenotrophomonas maltophilia]|uniref:hypothetical protein n=1 Tax=Stenotrophomonas TaxID=40323 RepID=UPI000B447C1B|nr:MULTISPECIES: hypothetical protein [Stenotrophomonas]ARZ76246.1 hypothetical protein CCR98_19420 [Stenotrophomonas sp. WZN-1]ELC7324569.1 hypothetical protein [Stenotrophomonas maltophilia]MBA0279078.1 hypothetical protein [Stenotrophomonas maltophilia]MBA0414603.1 hypothetical protein [Stenotrophomonas maltophilia]MBA0500010.1 hypothetical protein [Stenotrophomonas maltophilia]
MAELGRSSIALYQGSGPTMWRCRMNACVRLVLFTSMALCLLACTNPGGTASDVIAGSRSESYGPESAAQMEAKARSGDGHAQALAENHYREMGDAALYRQWMEEGVSRGDPAAMQRLASHLISLGGSENCRRAEVMLVRARGLVTDDDASFLGALDSTMRRLKGELPGSTPCK